MYCYFIKGTVYIYHFTFITIVFAAQTEAEDKMNYTAMNFPERKATRRRKKKEFSDDSVYSMVEYRLTFIDSDSVSA